MKQISMILLAMTMAASAFAMPTRFEPAKPSQEAPKMADLTKKDVSPVLKGKPAKARTTDFEVDGLYYSILNDNEVSLVGCANTLKISELTGEVTYDGKTYSVVEIGDYAFYQKSVRWTPSDEAFVIPSTVKRINALAFAYSQCGLSTMRTLKVVIPSTVEQVECMAFYNCNWIGSVEIYGNIDCEYPAEKSDYRHGSTFIWCENMTEIKIGEGIKYIPTEAFSSCVGVENIYIPASLEAVGRDAFNLLGYRSSDMLVHIPSVKDWVEIDQSKNEYVNGATYYGRLCVNGEPISDLVIPEGITKIGAYTFSGCKGITSVTFPSTLKDIYKGAFCELSTDELTFPAGLETVASSAFASSGVKKVNLETGISNWFAMTYAFPTSYFNIGSGGIVCSENGCIYSADKKTLYYIPLYNADGSLHSPEIVIPEGVQYLGGYAESKDFDETKVTLDDIRVTMVDVVRESSPLIYMSAWTDVDVTSVSLPSSLKLTTDAFLMPDSTPTNYLDDHANGTRYLVDFDNMSCLNYYMPHLQTINVASGNTDFKVADGVLYTADGKVLLATPKSDEWQTAHTAYTVPEGTVSVGPVSFINNQMLQSVSLPSTLAIVDLNAFNSCSELAELTQKSSFTTGPCAFYGTKIKQIKVGGKNIPYQAFCFCSNLEKVIIEEGVESIGSGAFTGCSNLTKLSSIEADSTEGIAILPQSVTDIMDYAFQGTGFSEFALPDALTKMGIVPFLDTPWGDKYADDEIIYIGNICYGLKSKPSDRYGKFEKRAELAIKDGTSVIALGAFRDLPAERISVPGSLKQIPDYAFSGSEAKEIIIAEGIESIGSSAFAGSQVTEITFPASLKELGGRIISSYIYDEDTWGITYPLTKVTSLATTPPEPDAYVHSVIDYYDEEYIWERFGCMPFSKDDYENADLIVPEGSEQAYAESPFWTRFKSINGRPASVEQTSLPADNAAIVGIYTLEGIRLAQPQRGINIVRYSDGSCRKIMVR